MRVIRVALIAAFIVSCSDIEQPAAPPQAAILGSNLTFLRFSDDAFNAAEKSGSFWAVRGQARSISLRYTDTGKEFLRFEVGPHSLQSDDSVQISVQVDERGELAFHFSPSGLKFNWWSPAILQIDYSRANFDIDGDADVDVVDRILSSKAAMWKRELPLLPWIMIWSVNLTNTVEKAKIYDFTSFGMAVD